MLYIPAEVEDKHVPAHGQLNESNLLRFSDDQVRPGVLDVQADELHLEFVLVLRPTRHGTIRQVRIRVRVEWLGSRVARLSRPEPN